MDEESVANFMAITDTTEHVARSYLEFANGDISQAVTLYFENPSLVSGAAEASSSAPPILPQVASSAGSSAQPARRNPVQLSTGRQDEHGIIHIDSDDDDMDIVDDDLDDNFGFADGGGAAEAVTIARSAQEEEDAAMAKRLQEELYAETATTSDGIRAPIARTTETLVAPSYGIGPLPDDDDDMEAAVMEQLRRRRQPRTQAHNPFSQNVWESNDPPAPGPPVPNGDSLQSARQARLADLYRPPYELIAHLSWDEARSQGREEKKWILANIQDMSDFNCQILNRDIWKNEAVKQIVSENFIFLQYTKDDSRASQYIQYYLLEGRHENPDNYPHVAIIDPRTGEQVKVWSGRPFPDALDFHAQLAEFLDRYSLAANSKNPVAKAKTKQSVKDVGRMTEEEMLQIAMQNSLETANGGSSSMIPTVHDPDDLTASMSDIGKGKEKAAEDLIDLTDLGTSTETPTQSVFANIPANKPHTEPANDPASTTRIQFRHSGGRVIRRFAINDPVVRIFEWLKAEPLESKAGVEFELKVMPQGKDLIQDLEKTIEEAGLKQATVMIEFIEE